MTDEPSTQDPALADLEELSRYTNELLAQAHRLGVPLHEGHLSACRVEALVSLLLPDDIADERRLAFEFAWKRRVAERAQANIDEATKKKLVIPG